jgi:hypothetical protein
MAMPSKGLPQASIWWRRWVELLDATARNLGLWLAVAWTLFLGLTWPALFYARLLRGVRAADDPHRWAPVLKALTASVMPLIALVLVALIVASACAFARSRRCAAVMLLSVPALLIIAPGIMIIAAGGLGPEAFALKVGNERHIVPWVYQPSGAHQSRDCASFVVHVYMPGFQPAYTSGEGRIGRIFFIPPLPGCSIIGDLDTALAKARSEMGSIELTSTFGLTLMRSADPARGTGVRARWSVLYERDPETGRVVRLIECKSRDPEQSFWCFHYAIADGIGYHLEYPGKQVSNWRELERRAADLRRSFLAG